MRAFVAYFSAHVYKFNTYSYTRACMCVCAECAGRKLFLGSFEYSGQPHSSSELRTAPLNFCITFRTVIFSLCLFYFVWDVHFYFHGIILYFYCASSEQFFIKFRFSTGPEIKCYLFVALGLVAAALRYAPISVPINQIVSIPPTPSSSRRLWPEHETPKAQKKIKDLRTFSWGDLFFCALYSRWAYRICVCKLCAR